MLEFIKKHILLIILVVVFISLIAFFLIREYIASKTIYTDSSLSNELYEMIPKTYDINEYTNIIISDEDMARIYLNDFINSVGYNAQASYYLLDEEYRNMRFGNIDNYISYISNFNYSNYDVSSYYKKEIDGYTIFGVYDQNGNFFAFKTSGVMQYSVFLDEDTVEIW